MHFACGRSDVWPPRTCDPRLSGYRLSAIQHSLQFAVRQELVTRRFGVNSSSARGLRRLRCVDCVCDIFDVITHTRSWAWHLQVSGVVLPVLHGGRFSVALAAHVGLSTASLEWLCSSLLLIYSSPGFLLTRQCIFFGKTADAYKSIPSKPCFGFPARLLCSLRLLLCSYACGAASVVRRSMRSNSLAVHIRIAPAIMFVLHFGANLSLLICWLMDRLFVACLSG